MGIHRFLQRDNDLRGIIEDNEAKQIVRAQIRTTAAQASRPIEAARRP